MNKKLLGLFLAFGYAISIYSNQTTIKQDDSTKITTLENHSLQKNGWNKKETFENIGWTLGFIIGAVDVYKNSSTSLHFRSLIMPFLLSRIGLLIDYANGKYTHTTSVPNLLPKLLIDHVKVTYPYQSKLHISKYNQNGFTIRFLTDSKVIRT